MSMNNNFEFDDFETQEQCEEFYQEFEHEEFSPEELGEQPDESMDGDFDSAMASAGLGTDEDYNHWETPLGEQYEGE